MTKFVLVFAIVVLSIGIIVLGIMYRLEVSKNTLVRLESSKISDESQAEVAAIKEELKKAKENYLKDNKRLLDQMTEASNEKAALEKEINKLKESAKKERALSLLANEDAAKLRKQLVALKRDSLNEFERLEKSIKRIKQAYDTRVLSLEAQVAKSKARYTSEAERYHYNLGVVYAQNKEYDSAVTEFKTVLGFNPKNALAHFNLGIIYDDYFKDKDNASYHYRSFLELSPASDDAESVREWLANLNNKNKK